MNALTLTALIIAAIALLASAVLAFLLLRQRRQLLQLAQQCVELQQNMATLQPQQHSAILALGQRVMESDKLVRRFNDRLDGLQHDGFQHSGPSNTQYGQLESLLAKSIGESAEASAAETELLSLLRQQQRPN